VTTGSKTATEINTEKEISLCWYWFR